MGERAKIIVNEYSALEIMKRPDFDINKFYSNDYKIFVKAAVKEFKNYNKLRTEYNNLYQENVNLKNQLMKIKEYTKDVFDDNGVYKQTGEFTCEHYDNFFEGLNQIIGG